MKKIPKKIVELVHERDSGLCGVCRTHPADGNKFCLHHVKYRSEGGADAVENLISVCPRCHDRLHQHKVFDPYSGWISLGSKRATQDWVRRRIKLIERWLI